MRRTLPQVGKSLAWMVVFVVVAVVGPRYAPPEISTVAVTAGGLVLAALSAWPAVRAYLETRNVEYVLTDRNVYESTASRRRTSSASGPRTSRTGTEQGRLGEPLRLRHGRRQHGRLGGSEVTFSDLNDPETFRDELRTVTRRYRSAEAETSAVARVLDAGTADALLDDARAMHETADRLATAVIGG